MPTEKTQVEVIDIDVRGQVCPATLLVAMESMNKYREALRAGTVVLCIRTDNRDATFTIPGTAKNMGYTVSLTKQHGSYEIKISRGKPVHQGLL